MSVWEFPWLVCRQHVIFCLCLSSHSKTHTIHLFFVSVLVNSTWGNGRQLLVDDFCSLEGGGRTGWGGEGWPWRTWFSLWQDKMWLFEGESVLTCNSTARKPGCVREGLCVCLCVSNGIGWPLSVCPLPPPVLPPSPHTTPAVSYELICTCRTQRLLQSSVCPPAEALSVSENRTGISPVINVSVPGMFRYTYSSTVYQYRYHNRYLI